MDAGTGTHLGALRPGHGDASVKASLDADGKIVDWQYEVWSNSHSTRPGGAGCAAGGAAPGAALSRCRPPKPMPLPEGGGDRNAIPLYTFPNAQVVHHFLPDMPLRVSAMRGARRLS